MKLINDPSLSNYLTMKIGGSALMMAEVYNLKDIQDIIQKCKNEKLKFYILGGGSNIIAHDETFNGIIIQNKITGMNIIKEDGESAVIKAGGGELWDDLVKMSVDMNLSGIEAMSIIPGTCGAAPVQNIGAYGQEIADTLIEVEAFNTDSGKVETIAAKDCEFKYRSSIFRDKLPGKYIILSITLRLSKSKPKPPFYASLQKYLDNAHITDYNVSDIRQAVIQIRQTKLPDPAKQPNSGSFFKNAIVTKQKLEQLLANYPNAPYYDMGNNQYKVPTGWLIDNCNLKGKLIKGMRINPANALVLINESASGYKDLAAARTEITATVYDKFGIKIEQEPLEI